MIAHCRDARYWHSEDVTCYVVVDKCPSCSESHPVVVLYKSESHEEFDPTDFLNGVLLPCGERVDLILERSVQQNPGGCKSA